MQQDPSLLQEFGGQVKLNTTWAKSMLRRLGIKNADKRIFKQLTKDEEFVKFAKSKLNNSECRLLGLGEKRVRKSKPVTKVKQTTLGDF